MSLPVPKGRQREVLYLPDKGHTVVLGTAGSGKTTLAILRSVYLADLAPNNLVLLVTFNRMLATYVTSLMEDRPCRVHVRTYHQFARGYLRSRGKIRQDAILPPDKREQLVSCALAEAREQWGPVNTLGRPVEAFVREFAWLARLGITDAQQYQEVERVGQGTLRLRKSDRPLVFDVYQRYLRLRQEAGYWYDWDDIALAVLQELGQDDSARLYKHVVIDEGQDFSPIMLRSLAAAIPPDGSLTFFGDVAQQIYGTRLSWRQAGLHPPKVWEFKENYRNSKQIADLALAICDMPYYKGTADLVAPNNPKADGPLPTLVKCSSIADETALVIRQANALGRTQSVAILLRRRDHEKIFLKGVAGSRRLHKDVKLWVSGPSVWVGPFAAAKGLEFDTVIIPYCNDDMFPDPKAMGTFDAPEDGLAEEGRFLYVGVTRARTGLIMTYSGQLSRLLPGDPRLFTRTEA